MAQLYRDRADSENTFDELKNQWGWGGFTTKDLKRCRFNAIAVALVYNWWSLFVRLTNPQARLEAINSRPFLLSGVARQIRHAGQQRLVISHSHRYAHLAQTMLMRVSRMLQQWATATAEQLKPTAVWQRACEFLMTTLTGVNWLKPPLPVSGSRARPLEPSKELAGATHEYAYHCAQHNRLHKFPPR